MLMTDRLSKLRQQKNMSRKAVAAALQLDQTTYGNYELGKRQPSLDTLDRLADFFDVSIDYLFGRTDDPTPPNAKKPVTSEEEQPVSDKILEMATEIVNLSPDSYARMMGYLDSLKEQDTL